MLKLPIIALSFALITTGSVFAATPTTKEKTATMPASSNQTLIYKTYDISKSDVNLGKLAQKKGEAQAVKDYGQMLVNDHSLALDQLERIAKNENVTLPKQVNTEYQQIYDRLSKLSGKAFDEAFLKQIRESHMKDIDVLKMEMAQTQSPELKQYIEKLLPQLRAHDEIAKIDATTMRTAG